VLAAVLSSTPSGCFTRCCGFTSRSWSANSLAAARGPGRDVWHPHADPGPRSTCGPAQRRAASRRTGHLNHRTLPPQQPWCRQLRERPTADTARGRRYGMLRAGCSAATGLPGLLSTFVRGPALRTNSLPGLQPNARDKKRHPRCAARTGERRGTLSVTLAHPVTTRRAALAACSGLVPHSCLHSAEQLQLPTKSKDNSELSLRGGQLEASCAWFRIRIRSIHKIRPYLCTVTCCQDDMRRQEMSGTKARTEDTTENTVLQDTTHSRTHTRQVPSGRVSHLLCHSG
jgi:hypothetical protein